jgi:hypothetical protein
MGSDIVQNWITYPYIGELAHFTPPVEFIFRKTAGDGNFIWQEWREYDQRRIFVADTTAVVGIRLPEVLLDESMAKELKGAEVFYESNQKKFVKVILVLALEGLMQLGEVSLRRIAICEWFTSIYLL